jgi:hypothetical protein
MSVDGMNVEQCNVMGYDDRHRGGLIRERQCLPDWVSGGDRSAWWLRWNALGSGADSVLGRTRV